MVKQAVCYSFSLNADEPMGYLRLTAPLREAGITLINGFENRETNIEIVQEADVIIFQREFPARFDDYQKITALARQEGKPIIFELDDLLFSLPETHPDRPGRYYGPTLLPMFQALIEADLVTVTTPKLREMLVDFNPNTVVLPNYLDEKLWQLRPPTPKDVAPLTIGYMGTNSHQPDLASITPVLVELLEQYPDRLKFHFWGAPPPPALEAQATWTSQYLPSYRDFTAFFQTQTADIFIAPLLDNPFNQGKSGLKFLEYSALGVPGVYSRLAPYSEIVTPGHDGLLASTPEEWREALSQLIEDASLRGQLATHAQTTLREKWLLAQNAPLWPEAYQRAFTPLPHQPLSPSVARMLYSFNVQLYETFQHNERIERALRTDGDQKDHIINQLNFQVGHEIRVREHEIQVREHENQELQGLLSQARAEIEQLQNEVLSYALSKSWRITRPLRKIGQRMKKIMGASNA